LLNIQNKDFKSCQSSLGTPKSDMAMQNVLQHLECRKYIVNYKFQFVLPMGEGTIFTKIKYENLMLKPTNQRLQKSKYNANENEIFKFILSEVNI